MADMSKFSPDNGRTVLNIKDATARSSKVDKSDFVYCEDGDTALHSYLAHDFFYRNGVWCQTSTDVEVGDTWIPDGEENSNYYASNIKIQNYLNLKLDMSGVATPQYTDIASKNFKIGDIISISHSLGQNYAPIMWKVVNPIRKNSLLNPSRNITPVTIQDLLEALAEAQSALIKDTVGWIGKNFNKGESGFIFVKSSAQSHTFAYAKPIISGNKYIISFNISDVHWFGDGYALRVGLTSDDYEWSIPISSTGRIYHEFTASETVENGAMHIIIPNEEPNDSATVTISDLMITDVDVSTDITYEPYHESANEYFASKELLKNTVGWTGKNLLNDEIIGSIAVEPSTGNFAISSRPNGLCYVAKIENNTDYTISKKSGTRFRVVAFVENPINSTEQSPIAGTDIVNQNNLSEYTFNSGNYNYLCFNVNANGDYNLADIKAQLEKGSVATSYEPYHKSVEEMFADLGTASAKNSTSVVTDSTDLVESGAVKDIIGWGNKNLCNYKGVNNTVVAQCKNGVTYTFSLTSTGHGGINLKKNDNSGDVVTAIIIMSEGRNSVTFTADSDFNLFINGYGIGGIGFADDVSDLQLEVGSTATAYEPYHASVDESKYNRSEANVLGAKNLFYLDDIIEGASLCTISNNGQSINVKSDSAGTYKMGTFKVSVKKNTDYKLTINIDYVSGKSRIVVADVNNTTIVTTSDITTDQSISLSFNSGNNEYVRIKLLCTTSISETGNINYNNAMLCLASDTDSTYQPYAQTNRELTVGKADNSVIAPVENGTTASQAYVVGDPFIRNGSYCVWKVAKTQGESIADTDYVVIPLGNVASLIPPGFAYSGDLDNLIHGYIYCNGNCTNNPTGNEWGSCITIRGDSTSARIQLYFSTGTSGAIYVRRRVSQGWSDWKEIVRSVPLESTATSANTDVSIDSTYNKIYVDGNVVNFKIRFTVTQNLPSSGTVRIANFPAFYTAFNYPIFSLRNRTAPFEEQCGCFLANDAVNNRVQLCVQDYELVAGTYEVTGTYIYK